MNKYYTIFAAIEGNMKYLRAIITQIIIAHPSLDIKYVIYIN